MNHRSTSLAKLVCQNHLPLWPSWGTRLFQPKHKNINLAVLASIKTLLLLFTVYNPVKYKHTVVLLVIVIAMYVIAIDT